MTTIRPSRPDDAAAILVVVSDAFADDTRDATEELAIVRRTWSACPLPDRIELVAVADGAVAGHVLAAPGRLDARATAVAGVAPVWLVEPSCTANIAAPMSAASSDPRLPTPESCGPGALLGKVLFKCDRTSL